MSPACVCDVGLVSTDAHGGALLRLPQDEGDTGVSQSDESLNFMSSETNSLINVKLIYCIYFPKNKV